MPDDIPRAAVEALRDLVEGNVEHGEPIPGPLLLLKLNALLASDQEKPGCTCHHGRLIHGTYYDEACPVHPTPPAPAEARTERWFCRGCGAMVAESRRIPQPQFASGWSHKHRKGYECGPVEDVPDGK